MSDQNTEVEEPERTILLAEYQAAQASAEHHDYLIWVVTSIVWGASLVLLGLALQHAASTSFRIPVAGLALLAILLHSFVWRIQTGFRSIKIQKYARCKAIEKQLKYMSQHSDLSHKRDFQTRWYVIIQLLFIIAWGIMGVTVFCCD